MNDHIYQESELLALLGDFADDYDLEGLEDAVTEVDYRTGNRLFTDEFAEMSDSEVAELLERFDLTLRDHWYVTVNSEDVSVLIERFTSEADARQRYKEISRTWWSEYGSEYEDMELWLFEHKGDEDLVHDCINQDDNLAARAVVEAFDDLEDGGEVVDEGVPTGGLELVLRRHELTYDDGPMTVATLEVRDDGRSRRYVMSDWYGKAPESLEETEGIEWTPIEEMRGLEGADFAHAHGFNPFVM